MGTDNGFEAVQIALCSAVGPDVFDRRAGNEPPTELRWSIASVETSTSGSFLSHLPAVALLSPPTTAPDASAKSVLEGVVKMPFKSALEAGTITIGAADGALTVSEHEPLPETLRKGASRVVVELDTEAQVSAESLAACLARGNSSVPLTLPANSSGNALNAAAPAQFNVLGWRRRLPNAALVFIHGYDGHYTCLKALGQFCNLSRLPAHITPIAFLWPSGKGLVNAKDGVLAYPRTCAAASSDATLERFTEFLQGLREAGVETLHIIAHSLGARVLCSALPRMQPLCGPGKDGKCPMTIASCTLLHPAYTLRQFVEVDYALLRALCEHITIYIDSKDNAQWGPELLFDHEPSLGLHPFALVTQLPERGHTCAERVYGYQTKAQLRLSDNGQSTPLDLDVVDTSFIDYNVEENRHGFWNVNRLVVDDLLETMTRLQRARYRQHRLTRIGRRGSNVWTFLAAPRAVGSVVAED